MNPSPNSNRNPNRNRTRLDRTRARAVARRICQSLTPFCDRISIAGSLRRRFPTVGDIEIVAQPHLVIKQRGLFAHSRQPSLAFYRLLDRRIRPAQRRIWGPRARSWYNALDEFPPVQIDLFIVFPPAQWGVLLAIRTGPADFSKRLVTRARALGLRIERGALWNDTEKVQAADSEIGLFKALDLPYLKPEHR